MGGIQWSLVVQGSVTAATMEKMPYGDENIIQAVEAGATAAISRTTRSNASG